jgi:large subunit ribosomal protein L6
MMSRTGKLPITVPSGVQVALNEGVFSAKGQKGELTTKITGDVNVTINEGVVTVAPANDSKRARAMWGTTRSNIANLVEGVSEGFTKVLEINGVGYRAAVQNNILNIALGYSHDIKYMLPEGVTITVEKQTVLTITGHDKQKVGQVASEIRALRKPEPYKGKGVRYQGEYIRMKEGKKK